MPSQKRTERPTLAEQSGFGSVHEAVDTLLRLEALDLTTTSKLVVDPPLERAIRQKLLECSQAKDHQSALFAARGRFHEAVVAGALAAAQSFLKSKTIQQPKIDVLLSTKRQVAKFRKTFAFPNEIDADVEELYLETHQDGERKLHLMSAMALLTEAFDKALDGMIASYAALPNGNRANLLAKNFAGCMTRVWTEETGLMQDVHGILQEIADNYWSLAGWSDGLSKSLDTEIKLAFEHAKKFAPENSGAN